jgi:putative ABC transport system substrate-binding protein
MMNRRTFLWSLTLGALAAPLAADAQQAGRTVIIGYLGNSSPSLEAELVAAFREGLRQLGYVDGQNLSIKYQWAEGRQERLTVLARELVQLKPDVILTAGTPGGLAAKQATQSIPIVMALAGDPLAAGLVASLARPGANVTGLSSLAPELEAKRLELLKQVLPKLSRVVVLLNPVNPFSEIAWKALQPAGDALGVRLQSVEARRPNDLDQALATIKAAHPDGLLIIPDRALFIYRGSIVEFITKHHLPGVFAYREFAVEGGLMAYGPDYKDMYRRAATYVDKILKGTRPGDLPIEQPTKFELVLNLKTAKALGLTIPPSLLLRADQVIE